MIVDKKLTVSNRKKVDIITELRSKQFKPFPKVSKAQAAGETEEVVEAEEDEAALTGASSDYDYLLGMPIWSLTMEKVFYRLVLCLTVFNVLLDPETSSTS
jgi:DNA topoisomerase-2